MKCLKIALCAATASLAFSSAALADNTAAPAISYSGAIASDYVFRGASQTKGKPSVSAGIDVSLGKLYAGGLLSNVDDVTPISHPAITRVLK